MKKHIISFSSLIWCLWYRQLSPHELLDKDTILVFGFNADYVRNEKIAPNTLLEFSPLTRPLTQKEYCDGYVSVERLDPNVAMFWNMVRNNLLIALEQDRLIWGSLPNIHEYIREEVLPGEQYFWEDKWKIKE